MSDLKPWEITNLAVGSVRVVYAPITQAVPTKIQDIIDMTSPYATNGAWVDFGAAKEASNYSRDMDAEGLQIQQETGDIMSEITEISRMMTASIAEITPENFKIVENAAAIETIAAAAGASAQKGLPIGAFTDLTPYRIAMFGTRKKQSGAVVEPGGKERGRLVGVVLNRVTLAAEEAEIEFEKGELVAAEVQFESFPEPDEDEDESYGRWLFEDAGTIA